MAQLRTVLALFLFSFFAAYGTAYAVVLDVDDVVAEIHKTSSPIGGIWDIAQQWDPSPNQALTYWMGITQNTFGVKNADYIGVVLCEKKGVTTGEVRLLLKKTKDKNKFLAVFLTVKGQATGELIVLDKDSLDLSSVVLKNNKTAPLIKRIRRVP